MKNSKFIKILKVFSQSEMKEFEKLIASPFFSKGRNLLPLFKQIKKYYPAFDNEKFNEKYIFNSLYPGKNFSKEILKKLTTGLMNLSIEYLKQITFRNNNVYVNSLTSWTAAERNLNDLALKLLDDIDGDLEQRKLNYRYYYDKELIVDAKNSYYAKNINALEKVFTQRLYSAEFMVKKFLYLASFEFINLNFYKNSYKVKIEDNYLIKIISSLDLEGLLREVKDRKTDQDIFMQINLYFMLCWKDFKEHKYYTELKSIIFAYIHLFDYDVKYLINNNFKYLTVQKNNFFNTPEYQEVIFEINKLNLKEKIFLNPLLKYIPNNEFHSYFLSGFQLGEYDWAEKFVKKYSGLINPKDKDRVINFCKSLTTFIREDYEGCIEIINLITQPNDHEKLLSYYLKAAAFYELQYYEESESVLNSYSKFMKNENSIRQDQKPFHLNFIKCLRQLLHFKNSNDKKYIANLESIMKHAGHKIILKQWIVETLKGLRL